MNYPSPFVCKIFLSLEQEVLELREKNKDSKKFYILQILSFKKNVLGLFDHELDLSVS